MTSNPTKSDEIAALLDLDPSHLAPDDRHLSHPACAYRREPWDHSEIVAFPLARNRAAMARIAVRVAEGQGNAGMGALVAALTKRARELHAACVPRDAAMNDLATMHREIAAMVMVLTDEESGSLHGGR